MTKKENDMQVNESDPSFECNSFFSGQGDTATRTKWFDIYGDYNIETIERLIQNPMDNNYELRQLSRRLYSSNGIVRNTLDYMTSIPTLDYIITSKTQDKKSKYSKEIYKHILDKIKHKEFVRDALLKGCIDGTAFYYFDTGSRPLGKKTSLTDYEANSISEINTVQNEKQNKLQGQNAYLTSLPTDYCKIVGIKNNSYMIAFDLDYFNEGNESAERKLRKYPKEIRDGYRDKKNSKNKWLILDNTKTIVHKISSTKDEPWGRPIALAAILDIMYSDYFTSTKRNVLDDVNNQIVYQTFPEGKETGTSALTSAQQKKQHNDVKNAIQNKNNKGGISVFSVAAGTKINKIDVNTDIFDDKNEANLTNKISTSLGFAASLLNASSTTSFSAQQTNLELVTSQIFQWVESITNELNKVINYNILNEQNIDTKVNYLPITHINKHNMIGYAKDLYLQGKGSLALWASTVGIPSDVFYAMLDEELEADIENKYPVHRTSYTQSSDDSKSGRPIVDNPTNENTIQSKSNNSNGTPKPQ